jgi:hypothetical protein
MASGNSLRISDSMMEHGTVIAGNMYTDPLLAHERYSDSELDIKDTVGSMDQMIVLKQQNFMSKWILAAMSIFSLLAITATVGLACCTLNKDVKTDRNYALTSSIKGENVHLLGPFYPSLAISTINPADGKESPTMVPKLEESLTEGSTSFGRRLFSFIYPKKSDCNPFKPVKPKPVSDKHLGSIGRRRSLLDQFESYTFTQDSCVALKASLITKCGDAAFKVHTFNAKAALEILSLQIDNPALTLSDPAVVPYLQDICYTDSKDLKGKTKCLAWERANLGAYAACMSLYDMYLE